MTSTTMQTYTGQLIDLLDPKPEQISIVDIAHHLSMLCRFNGAVREFYSVAQHSVMVAALVPEEHRLAALLHDAHEAYIGDIHSPMGETVRESAYRDRPETAAPGPSPVKWVKNLFDDAIIRRFEVPYIAVSSDGPFGHRAVKHADRIALATERRDLMVPDTWRWPILDGIEPHAERIKPLGPTEAKALFLDTFARLVRD